MLPSPYPDLQTSTENLIGFSPVQEVSALWSGVRLVGLATGSVRLSVSLRLRTNCDIPAHTLGRTATPCRFHSALALSDCCRERVTGTGRVHWSMHRANWDERHVGAGGDDAPFTAAIQAPAAT